VYPEDEKMFEWALQNAPWKSADRFRSVQAEIVNFADDVTYALHDIVDFARAELVPLKELRRIKNFRDDLWPILNDHIDWSQLQIAERDRFDRVMMALIVFSIIETSIDPSPRRDHMRENFLNDIAQLDQFASGAITEFLIGTTEGNSFPIFHFLQDYTKGKNSDCGLAIRALHAILKRFVFDDASLCEIKRGQEKVLTCLFDYYYDVARSAKEGQDEEKKKLLPPYFRDFIDDTLPERLAADIVASLTEQQAQNLYLRISGYDLGGFPLPAVRH